MYKHNRGARFEYRLQERQRAEESATLAGKYPRLKALSVDLTYYRPTDVLKRQRMKYEVNLEHAKSVFLFACPNGDCIQGDFDLSEKLAGAIARRQRVVTGEIFCRGWQKLLQAGTAQCQNSLQYKFSLTYLSGRS